MEEDYTPQSPTVTVLRPSSSADFHLAEQPLAVAAEGRLDLGGGDAARQRLLGQVEVGRGRRAEDGDGG